MKKFGLLFPLIVFVLAGCSKQKLRQGNLYQQTYGLPFIEGKPQYLASPFVTAGDCVYMMSYGSFPDLGWHIDGEMGGIWDHPIKLLDRFTARK